MPWWAWLTAALVFGSLLYWLLVITEGAYLGPQVVTALYDRFAPRYDRIKQFDPKDEAFYLGEALVRQFGSSADISAYQPLVLDIATGTGRYPTALFQAAPSRWRVVALDRSRAMLQQVQAKARLGLWSNVILLEQAAEPLPFADDQFDAVACLEALEFLPRPQAALREALRVLRPGGILTVSNRIGWQATLMPGKSFARPHFEALLVSLGASQVRTRPWQMDYDLVTARKPGQWQPRGATPEWPVLLRCLDCGSSSWITTGEGQMICTNGDREYRRREGIWSPFGR